MYKNNWIVGTVKNEMTIFKVFVAPFVTFLHGGSRSSFARFPKAECIHIFTNCWPC